jgi:hypothetical protein
MSTTTRRRFFGGAAILAAPLSAGAAAGDDLTARLAALEDANTIRAVLQGWAQNVSAGKLRGPAANIRSLKLDSDLSVSVAANGTATARVPCLVETATPIDGDETLVEMARQQGDGVVRRSERLVLAGTLVKHGGIWILERTELTA